MATYKVTTPKLAWQGGTNNQTAYATWTFAHSHVDTYEYIWYYATLQTKSGKRTLVWFQGASGSTTSKRVTYSVPENAYSIMIKVKAVSKTYKDKNKKDVKYFTGAWVSSAKWAIKAVTQKPEVVSNLSGTMTSYKNMVCVAEAPDDITTHIYFHVYRPEQGSEAKGTYKKAGSDTSGLVKVGTDGTARWNKTIAYPGYKYRVRAYAYNNTAKIAGDYSRYTPLPGEDPDAIYTVPVQVTGVKAVAVKNTSGGIDRDSLTVSWKVVYGATYYQIQYATRSDGFSNGMYTTVNTDGAPTSWTIDSMEIGNQYWIRVRAVAEKATYDKVNIPYLAGAGEWSATVTAILGKPPAAPTTWSNRLTAQIGTPVDLFWVHNSVDGSALEKSEVWYKAGAFAAQTVSVNPTYDSSLDMNSPNGQYKLSTTGFIDQSKIQWKVRTKGIYPEYSEYSVTREITVYAPPWITATLSSTASDTGQSLDVITEYPFYILLNAGPSTQQAIGFYVSISPDTSFKTQNPDGTERWVNAGETIYSEYFDFAAGSSNLTIGDYAVINGNQMSVKITPDKMSVPIDLETDGAPITYNVTASVSMNSGLSATNADNPLSFTTEFETLDFEPDGDITQDQELLCVTILPECREAFLFDESETYDDDFIPPQMPIIGDMSLAVWRYNQNGEFTLVGDSIPSEEPVSVTDPHPPLRSAVYRIVATSNKTGQMTYTDLDPIDLGENGMVIQWDETWTGLATNPIYGENGEIVEIDYEADSAWSGAMVKIPANLDISNTTSPDVELAKYDGRKRPVSYYGTQLNETGTWKGDIPKSDKETIEMLRHLQAWTGDCYIREPSGLGYWANVTVDMPVNHCELVVAVTLTITRVEGGL